MQQLNGGPRSAYSAEQVREALAFAHGGRYRWGVDLAKQDGSGLGDGHLRLDRVQDPGADVFLHGFYVTDEGYYRLDGLRFWPDRFSSVVFTPTDQVIKSSVDNGVTWTNLVSGQPVPGLVDTVDPTDVYLKIDGVSRVGDRFFEDEHDNRWEEYDPDWVPAIAFPGTGTANMSVSTTVAQPATDPTYAVRVECPFYAGFTATEAIITAGTNLGNMWWNTAGDLVGTIAGQTISVGIGDLLGTHALVFGVVYQFELRWNATTNTVSLSYKAMGNDLTVDTGWTMMASASPGEFSVNVTGGTTVRFGQTTATTDIWHFGRISRVCFRRVGAGTDFNLVMLASNLTSPVTPQIGSANVVVESAAFVGGVNPFGAKITAEGFDPGQNAFRQTVNAFAGSPAEFTSNLARIYLRLNFPDWSPSGAQTVFWEPVTAKPSLKVSVQSDGGMQLLWADLIGVVYSIDTPPMGISNGSSAWVMLEIDSSASAYAKLTVKHSTRLDRPAHDDPAWIQTYSAQLPVALPVPSLMQDGQSVHFGPDSYVYWHQAVDNLYMMSAYAFEVEAHPQVLAPRAMRMLWELSEGAPLLKLQQVVVDSEPVIDQVSSGVFAQDFEALTTLTELEYLEILVATPLMVDEVQVDWSYRPPALWENNTGKSVVRRTGELSVVGQPPPWFSFSARVRPYVLVKLADDSEMRFDIGTFVAALSPKRDDGVLIRSSYSLADYSFRISTTELSEPLQWTEDVPLLSQVKAILASVFDITSFVDPPGAYQFKLLSESLVFDVGETYADAINAGLQAIGLDSLVFDEYGELVFKPLSDLGRSPEWVYSLGSTVVVGGGLSPLMPDVPNVLEFVPARGGAVAPAEGDGLRTVTNQSVGPASIDHRGYEVVKRVVVDADTQGDLDDTAYEHSEYLFAGGGDRLEAQVLLNPLHSDRDYVLLDKPRLGVSGGQWNVVGWSILLGAEPTGIMDLTLERRQKIILNVPPLPATAVSAVWVASGLGGFNVSFNASDLLFAEPADAQNLVYYKLPADDTWTLAATVPWQSGANTVFVSKLAYGSYHYVKIATVTPNGIAESSPAAVVWGHYQPGTTTDLRVPVVCQWGVDMWLGQLFWAPDYFGGGGDPTYAKVGKVGAANVQYIYLWFQDTIQNHCKGNTPTAVVLRAQRAGSQGNEKAFKVYGVTQYPGHPQFLFSRGGVAGNILPLEPYDPVDEPWMSNPKASVSPQLIGADAIVSFTPGADNGTEPPLSAYSAQQGIKGFILAPMSDLDADHVVLNREWDPDSFVLRFTW